MDKTWLKEVYEANPEADVLYAVEKTKQAFYSEHIANDHARSHGAEVVKVSRAEVEASEGEATKVLDLAPSDKWTVAKIQEWLTAKEIAFDEKATKAQLLALVPAE